LQRAEAEIIFTLSLENMNEQHKLWTLQKFRTKKGKYLGAIKWRSVLRRRNHFNSL